MHAKYEVSISHGLKVMVKVKNYFHPEFHSGAQTDIITHK